MKSTSKSEEFQVRRVTARERGYSYDTYRLDGYLDGERVRRRFRTLAEALGEKSRLTIQATNAEGEIQAVNTRLSKEQVIDAEVAIKRLGNVSLDEAVTWYLSTYKPPVTVMALRSAADAFLADKQLRLRKAFMQNYRRTLKALCEMFPARDVGTLTTPDMHQFLGRRPIGNKRFNNLRGELHTFFHFCKSAPRQWIAENPASAIPVFKITRGFPEIISAQTAADLMAHVEAYAGWPGSEVPPGSLVPYFALCLFAGLRPSVSDGEIAKLAHSQDPTKVIDLSMNVIWISPEIAKTKRIRRVTIQPNLAAWLTRYPVSDYPIFVPNMPWHVAKIRRHFQLGHDVLRHTFVSMHVAKFKSLNEAVLEAGNTEAMLHEHYFKLVNESDAEAFWNILPQPEVHAEERTVTRWT